MKRPNIPLNFNGQKILRRSKPQGGVVGAKVGVTVGVVTLTLITVGFDVVGRRVGGIVEGFVVAGRRVGVVEGFVVAGRRVGIVEGFVVAGRRVGIVEGRLVGDTGATSTYMDKSTDS